MTAPRPPGEDAPAVQRLGWALRRRRGERTRRQLHGQLGYSVSTIKQVETGVYRSDLAPYMDRWAEVHGGLDGELQQLWAQVRSQHAPSRQAAQPAAAPSTQLPAPAGLLALPGLPGPPAGTAYLVIPVTIDAVASALGLPVGTPPSNGRP